MSSRRVGCSASSCRSVPVQAITAATSAYLPTCDAISSSSRRLFARTTTLARSLKTADHPTGSSSTSTTWIAARRKRCVEVLEAVHLLLAFELFVVVVAVDARWLSVALTDELRALKPDRDEGRCATPQDYLEKIFQLPFWVQPLTTDGRRTLVHGLLEGSVTSRRRARPCRCRWRHSRRPQDRGPRKRSAERHAVAPWR